MAIAKDFQDLVVRQEAHRYVLSIYKATNHFPRNEQFALTSQVRRAAASITSNIAEGFGRKQVKDKEHFYVMARGSLDETRNQLLLARDLQYLSSDQYKLLEDQAITVAKLLGGLLRAHKKF